ncbi:methionine biosynthesis protein MetW [Sandaracinobacter neustonicus]|uniref:Methionine biosynthesis protein MetW n=1 Tax=Sandaracinobacter neustonicus TaxID=1715348 RepID=A0A501XFJ5_9SPHN|nr:methionine biosynthesis protein MetW [Sandaracinobacter neustonicus]TPE59093.1 methionine biosynthesis protein MetW [Sandaracinobacter neustonicus]
MSGLPIRLQQVADQIPTGASVLDVGCSDGRLLAWLRDMRQVDGRGIEIDAERVAAAVARGLSVVQGDATHDLAAFPGGSVDYAVLSETLQAMEAPHKVLAELVRIGRRAVVAFPNFGFWRVRAHLALHGRMPVTRSLPVSWYESENIHFCTIADFKALATEMGLTIEREAYLSGDQRVSSWPNLRADHALFVLSK